MSQRCTGTSSKTGEPCRAWAVRGSNVCIAHGAAAKQVRAAAERRVTEAKVMRIIGPYTPNGNAGQPLNVWAMLGQLVDEVTWLKNQLGQMVAALRTDEWRYHGAGGEQLRAEVSLYERALDRTGQLLVACGRLGVEERLVQISEEQGKAVADILLRAVDRLGFGDALRNQMHDIVYEEICATMGIDPADRAPPEPPAWEPVPLATPLTPICELANEGVRGAEHGKCARPGECQCACHRQAAI